MRPVPLILSLLLVAAGASAHLAAGEDRKVGDYVVDFGHSPEEPRAGEGTALSFALLDKTGGQLEPESLWTRITEGRETTFAGRITPEETGTFLWKQQFPKAGTYEITARFEEEGRTLVETNFSLEVKTPAGSLERYEWGVWLFYGEFAVIIVLVVAVVVMSRKIKNSGE